MHTHAPRSSHLWVQYCILHCINFHRPINTSSGYSYDDVVILPQLRSISMVQNLEWPSKYAICWAHSVFLVTAIPYLCPCLHESHFCRSNNISTWNPSVCKLSDQSRLYRVCEFPLKAAAQSAVQCKTSTHPDTILFSHSSLTSCTRLATRY